MKYQIAEVGLLWHFFLIENWQLPACQEIHLAAKSTETAVIDRGFSAKMIVRTQ